MISREELSEIARARLEDARVLQAAERCDGAVYICGYAVEIALKARICRTLMWEEGFPAHRSEFRGLQSFQTHDLEMLLHLSGIEADIKNEHIEDWSRVIEWSPESRYHCVGKEDENAAGAKIRAAKRVLEAILDESDR